MRVFLTGATGYLGSAVSNRLRTAGHDVVGLARSPASADRLTAQGVQVLRGDLADTGLLARAAAGSDAVIHAAFNHDDWDDLGGAFALDATAVTGMLGALAGTGRPLLYTSGSGVFADTGPRAAHENTPVSTAPGVRTRIQTERAVLDAARHGVRGVVIRPGLVYGGGGGGTTGLLIHLARREGGPFVVGPGRNVWSAVHLDDLADLYLKALERADAGTVFHAANTDRTTMREIAAAAARAAGVHAPPRSLAVEAAREFAGGMAGALTVDKRIDATRARTALGWRPEGPSIIEDIERGSYAADPAPDAPGTGITMINNFEVPAEAAERFVADWLTDLDFMRRQAGFVEGTLYHATSETARFRYVNVARWRSAADFTAAAADMQRRLGGRVDRPNAWTDLGIRMHPGTFTVEKRF